MHIADSFILALGFASLSKSNVSSSSAAITVITQKSTNFKDYYLYSLSKQQQKTRLIFATAPFCTSVKTPFSPPLYLEAQSYDNAVSVTQKYSLKNSLYKGLFRISPVYVYASLWRFCCLLTCNYISPVRCLLSTLYLALYDLDKTVMLCCGSTKAEVIQQKATHEP